MTSSAEEFAEALGLTRPETADQPEPPTRRRPLPDRSQGSGGNGASYASASGDFADFIARLPRGDGSGNWRRVQ